MMETEIQIAILTKVFTKLHCYLTELKCRYLSCEMDLDLDRNVDQVLRQLCSFLADVYQYLDARISQSKVK